MQPQREKSSRAKLVFAFARVFTLSGNFYGGIIFGVYSLQGGISGVVSFRQRAISAFPCPVLHASSGCTDNKSGSLPRCARPHVTVQEVGRALPRATRNDIFPRKVERSAIAHVFMAITRRKTERQQFICSCAHFVLSRPLLSRTVRVRV